MQFKDKTVLVTGGTGSMGKTLVRRLLQGEVGLPKKIVVFSRDEAKQHDMRLQFAHLREATDDATYSNFLKRLQFVIGNVTNYRDLVLALRGVDIVINAAALKQVPTCEYFPDQAVMTNCLGAMNIVQAIHEHNYPVETVVGISTDKACKPINAMGMSKAMQERIFISGNIQKPDTRFICVRYGNVLASRGSVIPLFLEQIRNGGPVTITHPAMTRFLITLNQAVDTVFEAVAVCRPGEVLVPQAPSSLVVDIARALIGSEKVGIKTIGIRPGEKMHEIMISDEEAPFSRAHKNYFVLRSMLPELAPTKDNQPKLERAFSSEDTVLTYEQTYELLRRNHLIQDSIIKPFESELLR